MGKKKKVTYELRTTSTRNSPHWSSYTKDKEDFLCWAVKALNVFCAIAPEVNLLEIARLWSHPSRALIVHHNCMTQASGKSANALLRSIFNEIRWALDRGEEKLAQALVLSESCFTAYFLNDTKSVVSFLESFTSWPALDDDDLERMKASTTLRNVFAGTNTCASFAQNIEAAKNKVSMVNYLLLPPWLLQGNTVRLHRSLAIVEVTIVEKSVGTKHIIRLRSGHTFRTLVILLGHEAKRENSQTLRISHKDRPIFLSSSANRKLDDLGICDGDVMTFVDLQRLHASSQMLQPTQDSPTSTTPRNKSRRNTGASTKRKKQSSNQPSYHSPTMEKAKERHSKLLTQLFEEAEPVFREIRKILNDLAVKRSQPIKKVASISQVMANNPSDLGRGGAPGQIIFPIIVGNVEDLYKSSKYGNRNHSKSKNDTKRRLSIDLHGCTTDQALRSLNDSLPKWIENAMRGSYPFCSAVDIITGGGAQILSEAVEMWIQKQKHVARRPKSFTF